MIGKRIETREVSVDFGKQSGGNMLYQTVPVFRAYLVGLDGRGRSSTLGCISPGQFDRMDICVRGYL